jgi:hypothetical protein
MSEEKPEWQRESIDLTSIDQLQARLTQFVESERDILDRVEAAEGRVIGDNQNSCPTTIKIPVL